MAERKLQFIIEAENKANAVFKQVDDALTIHEKRMENITAASKKVAAVGAAAFGSIAVGIGVAISQASDLNESINAVNVVFGENAKTILDFGKTASTSIGLTKNEFNSLATVTGALLRDSFENTNEFANATTILAQRAADMASVFNTDVKDAMEAMNSALRGETEPIRRYAIDVSDATLNQYLLSQGLNKTTKDLSEAEKRQVRYNVIMEQSSVTAGDFANTSDGLANRQRILSAQFKDIAATIGTVLLPILTQFLEKIQPIINKITEWIEKNPKLATAIILIAGALAGLVTVIGLLGMALPGIITAFGFLAGAITAISLPMVLITAGIIALIALGILIYKNWETISAKAVEIWGSIAEFFTNIFQNIISTAITKWNELLNFFVGIWNSIQTIFNFAIAIIAGIVISAFELMGIDIVAVFQTIGEFFTQFWSDLTVAFQFAIDGIKFIWTTVWTAIKDFLSPVFILIKTVITELFSWISTKFKEWTEPLNKAWASLWSGIGGAVKTAFESVKNTIKSDINWIIDQVNKLIESINSLATKGAGVIGFKAPQIPTIPKLATGGIVNSPTLAMIGEAGPEAVIPLNRGLSGAGIGGITINITGNQFLGEEGIAEKIGNDIMRAIKANIRI